MTCALEHENNLDNCVIILSDSLRYQLERIAFSEFESNTYLIMSFNRNMTPQSISILFSV